MQLRAISNSEFIGQATAPESSIGAGLTRTGEHVCTKVRGLTERSIQGIHRLQDLVVILIAGIVSFMARDRIPFPEPVQDPVESLAAAIAPIALGWWTLLHLCGAYSMRGLGHGVAEYRRILMASMLTFAGLTTGLYLTNQHVPRAFVVGLFLVGVPMLMVGRRVTRAMINRLRQRGICTKRVLLAGSYGAVEGVATVLRRETWLGLHPVGVIRLTSSDQSGSGPGTLRDPSGITRAVEAARADTVIFCDGAFAHASDFNQLARQLERHDVQTIVAPALSDISAQRMTLQPVAGLPLVYVEKPTAEASLKATKRAFDIILGSACLVMALPILLLVAVLIKLEDGGPVLFRQERVGRGGNRFTMFKLRSMVLNAEHIRAEMLEDANESDGVLFKIRNDPRITKVGRFIRRYSIDELPQIWNVIRGDMSIVGPRPALPAETACYEDHVRRRLDVRPGLTGLWQVSGRSGLPWDETVRLDLYYVDNWSLLQDVNILFRTAKAVLSSDGAY